jgi:protein SCO1/2
MNDQFRTVQQALLADGTHGDWNLLSITIDPQHDTPERLAAFAQRYEADPAHWIFLTGGQEEIEKLGQFFGVALVRNGVEWNHNLRTVVVDAAGRVRKIFTGNEWKPAELAAEMQRAMDAAR